MTAIASEQPFTMPYRFSPLDTLQLRIAGKRLIEPGEKVATLYGPASFLRFEGGGEYAIVHKDGSPEGSETVVFIASKNLYDTQVTVREKMLELKEQERFHSYRNNTKISSYWVAALIERNSPEYPQLEDEENLETLCETLPIMFGREIKEVEPDHKPSLGDTNAPEAFKKLIEELDITHDEGIEILKTIYHWGSGHACNTRIGSCQLCRVGYCK